MALTKTPLSLKNWKEYKEEAGEMTMLGYWEASNDNLEKLKKILKNSKSPKEFKQNIVKYIDNRETFVRSKQ